jgi:hypothetical protein
VDISPIREAIKADPTAIVSLIPHLHRQWECATDSPTL